MKLLLSPLLSAGFIHDSTVHDLDMACWLTGEYPTEVFCVGQANFDSVKDAGDVDTLIATLKFPSGILAVIDQSRVAAYGYDQRLEVKSRGRDDCTSKPHTKDQYYNNIHWRL